MSIGEWDYKGCCVAQARGVPELLNELGQSLKDKGDLPTSIIEIGTYYGGFTTMLLDSILSENCEKILSFEVINRANLGEYFQGKRVDFRMLDVFSAEGVKLLHDTIGSEGKSLVFCDGGDKCREFNAAAPALKSGDMIFAHDYAHNSRVFRDELQNKIWNWFELEYDRIEGVCNTHNLQKCDFTEKFEGKAWACFQKE